MRRFADDRSQVGVADPVEELLGEWQAIIDVEDWVRERVPADPGQRRARQCTAQARRTSRAVQKRISAAVPTALDRPRPKTRREHAITSLTLLPALRLRRMLGTLPPAN